VATNGIAGRVVRDKFYEELIKQYGTSKEEIIRILSNAGQTSFSTDKQSLSSYKIIVNAYFEEKKRSQKTNEEISERIANAADKAGEWRKFIFPTPYNNPCDVEGCDGTKIFVPHNSTEWSCSKGGRKHYNAVMVAEFWAHSKGIEEASKIHEKAAHFAGLPDIVERE